MIRTLLVHDPGPLTTVQDLGRPGRASLGVGRSGACDRQAHRLANALVGNDECLATLEVTLGGLSLEAGADLLVATAGARCPGAPHLAPFALAAGQRLTLGAPTAGLRTYLAVRGGVAVPPVLGSRATDLLSGLGPRPLAAGDRLPVGPPTGAWPAVDVAAVPEPSADTLTLPVLPGPRHDWLGEQGWAVLLGQTFTVSGDSNRIGVRLDGTPVPRRAGELVSEGLLRGALQLPPAGLPVLFLADHPVTGGYPVVGYLPDRAVDACAQLRPGQGLRLVRAQP